MAILTISLIITSLLFILSIISSLNQKNKEKIFSFECGFNPMSSPQAPFSIQFFKIILVFLIFDMEIIVVLPLPFFLPNTFKLIITIIIIVILLLTGLIFE